MSRERIVATNRSDNEIFELKKRWNILYKELKKLYPERLTFLDYQTPWQLLVAVILSAQTTDTQVNKITPALFKKFKTVQAMAYADFVTVSAYIRSVGYYQSKARYIINTAQIIVAKHKNKIPKTMAELLELPGVGRKTANVVLGNLYGILDGIAVDTHVLRFAKRFGFSPSSNPNQVERDLMKIIPQSDWIRAGYYIKQYGRGYGRAESRGYQAKTDPLVVALEKKG